MAVMKKSLREQVLLVVLAVGAVAAGVSAIAIVGLFVMAMAGVFAGGS